MNAAPIFHAPKGAVLAGDARPSVDVVHARDGLHVTQVVHQAPADELRPLSHWAEAWGLERKGLERQATRAGVPIVKIGRERCARRSDLLAMVDTLRAASAPKLRAVGTSYSDLVRVAEAKR